jgi:hypothetical protein
MALSVLYIGGTGQPIIEDMRKAGAPEGYRIDQGEYRV